jgi:uncharacterized phage-like protein YoqJ
MTLCFTGHRYYIATPDDRLHLDEALETAFADGYRVFISGMAEGFDMAAAEAVLRLRNRHPEVALVAAVPFPRQAAKYRADNKIRYEELLAAADRVEVLSERYSHGCYYRRDDWMTEHSSRLVCWYDGSKGGTQYTVKSALRGGLEIINIYRNLFNLG